MHVPDVGPVTATALVASVGDARTFKNGRQFAAWVGHSAAFQRRDWPLGGRISPP